MKLPSVAPALAILISSAAPGWAQIELLTNPGFEDGVLAPWTVSVNPDAVPTPPPAGAAVVMTSNGVCHPAMPFEGNYYVSFSTDDPTPVTDPTNPPPGNNPSRPQDGSIGIEDEVRLEQTYLVSSDPPGLPDVAAMIASGNATIDVVAATTAVECLPSPDEARFEVEFFGGGASLAEVTTSFFRPPDGSGSTPDPPGNNIPNDPRESNWAPHTLNDVPVPVGTDTIVFRYATRLGAEGTSIGVAGDDLSVTLTPVELQSFSIE